MNTVKELINNSIGLLKNDNISGMGYEKPHFPVCVVYFGRQAQNLHQKIYNGLIGGWSGNADFCEFFAMLTPEDQNFYDLKNNQELDYDKFKINISQKLSSTNIFADMTHIALYCIIDTTEMDSEEFENWYNSIIKIQNIMNISTISMLMININESLQHVQPAKTIKNKLYDLYKNDNLSKPNSHLYDGVFIYSNRQKNGGFTQTNDVENIYNENNIFSDIILLSNTKSTDFNKRRNCLYDISRPALTAACNLVQKPTTEIIMITMNVLIEKFKKMINSHNIDIDMLSSAIGINNGKFGVCEEFFNEIKPMFPNDNYIKLFPNKPSLSNTYEDFDNITDNCLKLFHENNQFKVVETQLEKNKNKIINEITLSLTKNLHFTQFTDGINENIKELIFSKLEINFQNIEKMNVIDATNAIIKQKIFQNIKNYANEAINITIERSILSKNYFNTLINEFEKLYSIVEEGIRHNLTDFYATKINRFFNDEKRFGEFIKRIFDINNSQDNIFEILFNMLKTFFGTDEIYKMSFVEELTQRLGQQTNNARTQNLITSELLNNLYDKIGFFSSNIFQERIFEAYMLNTDINGNNQLYNHINNREIPPEADRTFYNTRDNNIVKSIWFYNCSEDNLKN